MLRDLWILRSQTLTIATLIICGISLLVASWSAHGSLQTARDNYYKNYFFADVFADFTRASTHVLSKIEKINGVQSVNPRIVANGLISIVGHVDPSLGRFISIPSGKQPYLNRLHLRQGRLPVAGIELEAVVHEGFAKANKIAAGDTITAVINGHNVTIRIVGIGISPEYIYALGSSIPLPDDLHFGIFWAPLERLQKLTDLRDSYNSVVLSLSKEASIPQVVSAMDQLLKEYGSFGAYARDRQISNMFLEDEIAEQKVTAVFVPTIFLAIATFLVNIVASRLVSMHRAQIAALKAMGYTRWEVSAHYLKLIFMMTLTGTIPGIAIGAGLGRWMSNLYASYFRFPELNFAVSIGAASLGLVAGILPGILGAWSGIYSAFSLAPAEAMRPQSPPAFHASLFEKLAIHKWLGAREKMIVRNIFFKPFRLILSLFSLSTALAIVVTASSWSDMIDYLLKTQFQTIQREDVSVTMLSPRSSSIIREILSLPGVIAAEGLRVVPIRLRFQHHKREIALTGWPENISMRQRLDKDLHFIPLPEDGILLSRFFADHWNMKPGDTVEVEPIEGAKKIHAVVVRGFVNDLIGISASMRIEELWQLLGEEQAFNQIMIKADPLRIKDLYKDLTKIPQISSVLLKESIYHGFRESFGQIIQVSTGILIVASLLIALGIIYNSLRISFSERSWELASLRILGFRRGSISAVLLVEVSILVVLSLAPGCFLGLGLTHLSIGMIRSESFGFPIVIQPATYAKGILAIFIAFICSSWNVHRMVGRLNPADALKARD